MPEPFLDAFSSYLRQQQGLGMPDYVFLAPVRSTLSALASGVQNAAGANPGPGEEPGTADGDTRSRLARLYHATRNCVKCTLGNLRTRFVFGSGNAEASLMVIGEAPGEEEDRSGMPFVGPAGNLLTKMLSAINLDRARDVFITNILKCRPPGNRTPAPAETVPCMHILKRQIEIIAPKVLLLLGRIAAQEVLGRTESIAVLRGEKLDYNGVPVIVTYHPAALLRNAQYKAPAWEDLKRLQKILKEM